MNTPVMDTPNVDPQGKGQGRGPDWKTYRGQNDSTVQGNLKRWESDHKKIAEGEGAAAKLESSFGTDLECEKQRKTDLETSSQKVGKKLAKLASMQQTLKCLEKRKDDKSKQKAEQLKGKLETCETGLKAPMTAWEKAVEKAEGKKRAAKVKRAEKMNALATSG